MSVNKIKTLPPHLNSRFYDSKLIISLKSLKLKGLSTLAVKNSAVGIRWWGETTPSLMRTSITYSCAADILKPYLLLCQVLELTVTCLPNKNDVGSAFLYNPVFIFNTSSFSLDVYNHEGCSIGLMVLEILVSNSNGSIQNAVSRGKRRNSKLVTEDNVKFPVLPPNLCANRTYFNQDKSKNSAKIIDRRNGCNKTVETDYMSIPNHYKNVPSEVLNFLLGKEMTGQQERMALAILHEWSPSQSFVSSFLDFALFDK